MAWIGAWKLCCVLGSKTRIRGYEEFRVPEFRVSENFRNRGEPNEIEMWKRKPKSRWNLG